MATPNNAQVQYDHQDDLIDNDHHFVTEEEISTKSPNKEGYYGFNSLEVSSSEVKKLPFGTSISVTDKTSFKLYRIFLVLLFLFEIFNIVISIKNLLTVDPSLFGIIAPLVSFWDIYQITLLFRTRTSYDVRRLSTGIRSIRWFMKVVPVLSIALFYIHPYPIRMSVIEYLPLYIQIIILVIALIVLECVIYVVYLYPALKIKEFIYPKELEDNSDETLS